MGAFISWLTGGSMLSQLKKLDVTGTKDYKLLLEKFDESIAKTEKQLVVVRANIKTTLLHKRGIKHNYDVAVASKDLSSRDVQKAAFRKVSVDLRRLTLLEEKKTKKIDERQDHKQLIVSQAEEIRDMNDTAEIAEGLRKINIEKSMPKLVKLHDELQKRMYVSNNLMKESQEDIEAAREDNQIEVKVDDAFLAEIDRELNSSSSSHHHVINMMPASSALIPESDIEYDEDDIGSSAVIHIASALE